MHEGDEHVHEENQKGDPTRIIALTDGVFAIIMTILVLELKLPSVHSNAELWIAMKDLCFTLFLYAISFLLAGVYWVGHRNLFNMMKRVNITTIWINIGFLMLASLIPFAASLLGHYSEYPLALQGYGLLLFMLASYRLFMYVYVTGNPQLLFHPVSKITRRNVIMVMLAAPALFGLSVLCSPDFPRLAIAIYAFTPPMFVTLITYVNQRSKRKKN